ncbi:unnamed protein product [Moneuplotes crassus]|uniref:Uncharacterized protein n=1 Tax=Euplotes crassus TaxID=5936 RepID=A0AAD1U8M0_EUPCR|nr:unnamed protein product [Moneuplotes crassus]
MEEMARDDYKQLLDSQEFQRKSHLQKIKDHVMRVLNRTDGFKLSSKRTPMEARMSQKMFPDQNTGFQVHPYNNLDKKHMKFCKLKAIQEADYNKLVTKKKEEQQSAKDLVSQILTKKKDHNLPKQNRNHGKSLNLTSIHKGRKYMG